MIFMLIEDWRVDGIRWFNNGTTRLPKHKENKIIIRYYFQLQVEENRTDARFQRAAYRLIDQAFPVLVHYIGDDSLVQQYAHKLSKDNSKIYTRTLPSTLETIRNEVDDKTARIVYNNYQSITRDQKQISNMRQYVNQSKRIQYDEIYNSLLISNKLNCIEGICF